MAYGMKLQNCSPHSSYISAAMRLIRKHGKLHLSVRTLCFKTICIALNEIQSYFVSDIQHYLESKGKTVIVWDDVIDGKADNNLVMMYWRDWVTDSPSRCAANGNSIILAPWSPFYISGDHTDKTLQDLYDYDPETVLSSQVNGKGYWSSELSLD